MRIRLFFATIATSCLLLAGSMPARAQQQTPQLVFSAAVEPAGTPAIFYSPHQDDETLAMGASIAEHVRVGRPVYVVLMARGNNTSMLDYLRHYYRPNAVMQDVVDARNDELIRAVRALGAHRVYISNGGLGYDEDGYTEAQLVDKFKSTVLFFNASFPFSSHKGISGAKDIYDANGSIHPTHRALATALTDLNQAGTVTDVRLYRDYIFYFTPAGAFPSGYVSPHWSKPVAEVDKVARQNAMDQYYIVDAANNKFGLGWWASVPDLFVNSYHSLYEYIDFY